MFACFITAQGKWYANTRNKSRWFIWESVTLQYQEFFADSLPSTELPRIPTHFSLFVRFYAGSFILKFGQVGVTAHLVRIIHLDLGEK